MGSQIEDALRQSRLLLQQQLRRRDPPIHYTTTVRIVDILFAALAIILLLPLLAACSLAIVLDDGFPVLFRQQRLGLRGRPFWILKFRSMKVRREGPNVTAAGDHRITKVGRILRRYKLDELPQFWNVLRGDMALVGPRPEIPVFVVATDPSWLRVLSARPGITDLATLMYRNEEQILSQAAEPEQYYRDVVLPTKLALNIEYLRRRSTWTDLLVIALTLEACILPQRLDAAAVRKFLLT